MSRSNYSLQAELGVDSSAMRGDLQRAERTAAAGGKKVAQGLSGGMGAALSGIKSWITGVATIGAALTAVKGSLDLAGEIQDTADALNVSTDAVQELTYAFQQNGAGAETVNKGLLELQKSTQEVAEGNEKTTAAFQRLGVSANDLRAKAPDEILNLIAASANEAHNPTQRLADLMAVLGKSGAKLSVGLNAGSEAFTKLRGGASKVTQEQLDGLNNLADGWDALVMNFRTGTGQFVADMAKLAKGSPLKALLPGGGGEKEPETPSAPVESEAAVKARQDRYIAERSKTPEQRRADRASARRERRLRRTSDAIATDAAARGSDGMAYDKGQFSAEEKAHFMSPASPGVAGAQAAGAGVDSDSTGTGKEMAKSETLLGRIESLLDQALKPTGSR